jgi:hypothetical protein
VNLTPDFTAAKCGLAHIAAILPRAVKFYFFELFSINITYMGMAQNFTGDVWGLYSFCCTQRV